jgi:hypothetical protein
MRRWVKDTSENVDDNPRGTDQTKIQGSKVRSSQPKRVQDLSKSSSQTDHRPLLGYTRAIEITRRLILEETKNDLKLLNRLQ